MSVFCVYFVIDQQLELSDSRSWAAPDRARGTVRQGRRHGSSITYKIKPCWVTLLQPARWAAVFGQPSSLRPHCNVVHGCTMYIQSQERNLLTNATKVTQSLFMFGFWERASYDQHTPVCICHYIKYCIKVFALMLRWRGKDRRGGIHFILWASL
jgi:hypothetical protein